MNNTATRRAVGLVATPALALATLVALPATPSYAADPDPAPVAAGAAWLESQLTNGLIHNSQYDFDDLGLSVDVALGLDAVGGHDAAVQEITDAIAANIDAYTSYQAGATPDTTHYLAGSYAKALALAVAADRDGRAFGGHDLVADLEGQIATEAPNAGRIQDTYDASVPFESDFANTIGQAFAVQGLDAEDSTLVDPATDFLLAQQCSEGYFRLNFTAADSPTQTCDADPAAAPDTDVTALAVIALQSQTDDTDIQKAVTKATTWLGAAQRSDGSFGGGTSTEAPNANSTGLAAWALGVEGNILRAAEAASWVRGLQADDTAPCASGLTPDNGAVAYDAAARDTARGEGITDATEDQFRRASAQALPGLQWAPADATGGIVVMRTESLPQAGTTIDVETAWDLAPGDTVCVTRAGQFQARTTVGPSGQAVARVKLPAGTGARKFDFSATEGLVGSSTVYALGATRLGLKLGKARVERGERQVVKVTGLAHEEFVKVVFRGRAVVFSRGNRRGVAFLSFKTTGKLGSATVKVVGKYANRKSTIKTFTVTR